MDGKRRRYEQNEGDDISPSKRTMTESRPMEPSDYAMSAVTVSPASQTIYISQEEKQFAGFRSAKGDAVIVNRSTLQHVKDFHDTWSKFAEEQVKDLVDPDQPL